MINLTLDADGTPHCGKCGSTSFIAKRTFASKAAFGVAALLAAKKLKCNACGTYNQTVKADTGPKKNPKTPKFDQLTAEQNAAQLARIRAMKGTK